MAKITHRDTGSSSTSLPSIRVCQAVLLITAKDNKQIKDLPVLETQLKNDKGLTKHRKE